MKRRNFIKLIGVASMIVAIPVIPTFQTAVFEHPEVAAVLNRFPDDLLPNEKLAIARFVIAEKRNGNWDFMESMVQFFPNSETNSLTNWIG